MFGTQLEVQNFSMRLLMLCRWNASSVVHCLSYTVVALIYTWWHAKWKENPVLSMMMAFTVWKIRRFGCLAKHLNR